MVNYTYVDSSVLYYLSTGTATTPATQIHDQFLNVSPHSVNATLYYEDTKLSARVSVAYRDEYLTALPFKSEVPDANGSYATTNIDASISYQLTPQLQADGRRAEHHQPGSRPVERQAAPLAARVQHHGPAILLRRLLRLLTRPDDHSPPRQTLAPQTPFGETFRFPVWGDDLSGDLGFTLADPAAPRLDLEVAPSPGRRCWPSRPRFRTAGRCWSWPAAATPS
jgi:hypothetical protein